MDLTIKIDRVCVGSNHIDLTVTKNGIESRKILMLKEDFVIESTDWETVIVTLMRSYIKEIGITGMANIKTAIEGKVFKL